MKNEGRESERVDGGLPEARHSERNHQPNPPFYTSPKHPGIYDTSSGCQQRKRCDGCLGNQMRRARQERDGNRPEISRDGQKARRKRPGRLPDLARFDGNRLGGEPSCGRAGGGRSDASGHLRSVILAWPPSTSHHGRPAHVSGGDTLVGILEDCEWTTGTWLALLGACRGAPPGRPVSRSREAFYCTYGLEMRKRVMAGKHLSLSFGARRRERVILLCTWTVCMPEYRMLTQCKRRSLLVTEEA